MATPSYDINYEDERFTKIENDKEEALNDINNTYDNMINQSDKYYQDQINAVKDYETTQKELQQQNTDLTIEKIENEKQQAEKDYTREQSGAYVDWQKQLKSNEQAMADMGLANTGFSESSQVSMYNTYQNRVATARESYNKAVVDYNLAIKDAKVANSSALAEIAYNALQAQLELSLQGFQYKNELLQTQIQQQQATEDRYYSRWQDVLNQMNQENQFAESIRQYEQNYQFQQQQFAEEKRQFQLSYDQQIKEFDESIRQFNEEIARLKKKDAEEYAMEIQKLELQKQQVAQAKLEADREYQLKAQQVSQEQARWEKEYALAKQSAGGGGGGGYTDTGSGVEKYGYFSNGYQPKGVEINGKAYELKSSGLKVWNVFSEGTSNKNATTFGKQNIWEANGRYFIWDGSIKDYVDVTSKVKTSQEKKVNFKWGS